MQRTTWIAPFFFVLVACGESDDATPKPKTGTPIGNTACERIASLRQQLDDGDCTKPVAVECSWLPSQCEEAANAWVECLASDLSQCLCESDDGSLNCEGSFKPDEGPAKCIAEYQKLDDCVGD